MPSTRHPDEPLRGGATGEPSSHVDRGQAEKVAAAIEERDDIGLPVDHPPAIESWW
jgi:hypothetical protein